MTHRVPMKRADRRRELLRLGAERDGIFTASAARVAGIPSSLLAYHARKGFIERIGREVYRVADFPPSPNEGLISVGVAFGDDAVISHESALKLYGVSDVSPSQVHVTVPRSRRYLSDRGNEVKVHTATRPFSRGEVVQYMGFRATSLARSIVDSARAHAAPEQIAMAVKEGLRKGLITTRELERALNGAPKRVRRLVQDSSQNFST
jgi:predicted transcriptional regulator of viral defense system